MKKITKILLPTDLSEVSLGAMEYACQLAVKSRASIYLLHVIENHESCTLENSPVDCACSVQQKLEDAFHAPIYQYENIVCIIRRGHATTEILKFAAEEKVDLIIMTTHGKGYLTETNLGTIAEYIMHNSNIPIILVHPSTLISSEKNRRELQI